MRWILAAVLVLAACHKKGAPEPAWPKSAGHVAPETWEEDGGESLEPQHSTEIEDSDSGTPIEALDADLQALMDLAMRLENETTGDDGGSSDEMIIIDDDPAPATPDPVP